MNIPTAPMRLTLRQLQIFLAVCEGGSTMAAALALSLSQSAASAALNELEALLAVRLFDRVGKRLRLNDDGRLLVPQARQMLETAAAMMAQYRPGAALDARGLRIGASTTIGIYVLPAILATLAQVSETNGEGAGAAPQVTIANTAEVAAAVAAFEVDAGLIEGPCHETGLQVEPWLEDELVLVGAPRAQARHAEALTLAQLRGAGWLLREPGSGTREAVEQALLPHLHALRAAGQFSNSEAIKHAAGAGLGIACLPRVVVRDWIAGGRLRELRTVLPPLRRRFYLIYRHNKIPSARLAGFLQACRAHAPA